MKTEFLNKFIEDYQYLLNKRFVTFYQIFDYLESLDKDYYSIVETGCVRDVNNYSGDGCSTLLFDRYLNHRNGILRSVDINLETINNAKNFVSDKVILNCEDSVKYLYSLKLDIDLLYLDSFDLNWNNPHPSAFHHIKELLAISSNLKNGTLIVVDDNANNTGKGQYLADYMANIGKTTLFNDYQIGWVW